MLIYYKLFIKCSVYAGLMGIEIGEKFDFYCFNRPLPDLTDKHIFSYNVIFHPSATSRIIIKLNPNAKKIVPILECCPCDISGINSSTTTYNIAPAAKLSKYGNAGITSCAARIVSTAPIGSTTPESTPPRNAFPLLSPSALRGIDIIAPSGNSE